MEAAVFSHLVHGQVDLHVAHNGQGGAALGLYLLRGP